MTERAYTVNEIERLRRAVENKWLFGSYNLPKSGMGSRSYKEDEKSKCVEELVRTWMIAGKTAEDLYASEMQS